MRRIGSILLSFVLIFTLTACGQYAVSEKQETEEQINMETETELSESVLTQQEADLAYYTDGRADQEKNDPDVRPAISGGVENMDAYDIIDL